ncbi:hypothetical protein P153DRAFT_370065 [Dothidotthia symphoricarpi CBS 119687]|uniref:BRCT domain-containing protein n=1 Tax=Dothidotthia symphoricarpi CBS 119687 TaxID=1392245 RepID=A0A6A6A2H1_9PLEO|nr:uncharacterized protein P153DRAFT_370065 [Dothidotthia symphoricarpi CBS 119687]KAF2125395.1 hypothetical protein P153DRAFT_370065 [Dothidotthia symphoricarpi CBS 119687]
MRESQERRKRKTRIKRPELRQEDSWDELSRRVQQKKATQQAKEKFDRDAAKSLSHISAPMLAPTRPVKKLAGEGKENEIENLPDESSQDVFSTARSAVKYNSKNNRVEVPKTSSHPDIERSGTSSPGSSPRESPPLQMQRKPQFRAPGSQSFLRDSFLPQSSRESVAVMDSQPDATADFESIPRPKSLRYPSSPSIEQYSINQTTIATKTGYTSQIVSSSMPPMPPHSSPEEVEEPLEGITPEEEERVPSSPPVLCPPEDDVTQHTYDEYAEGEGNITESDVADEDTVMEDDDDFPATKGEPSDEELEVGHDLNNNETDLIPPLKVDLGTDQEVPETLEQNEMQNVQPDDDALMQSRYTEEHDIEMEEPSQIPPRMHRQNTIPETDALDETQPSFFPDERLAISNEDAHVESADDELAARGLPVSTEPFQTARENQSVAQVTAPVPTSSKDAGSDTIQIGDRIHSLHDIANLPETQQSEDEEIFEMPRLSGLDENEEDTFMTNTSFAPPSAKRRKVMYTAKKKGFPSPVRPAVEPFSDAPPSSPLNRVLPVREDTPPTASAQARENRGAHAAVQAREEAQAPYSRPATLKTRGQPRISKPQHQRKGALKPVARELLQTLSSPVNTPSKPKASAPIRTITPPSPTAPSLDTPHQKADVDMSDVGDKPDEVTESPQATNVQRMSENAPKRPDTPTGDVLVPNRVFASWPGSHYYPATCIGRSASRQYHIRYDDGNTTFVDTALVRALALRTGDHVKVDETGMKKHTYVVVGFKDIAKNLDPEEYPSTDRFGHTTIVLEEKQRDSLPAAKAAQPAKQIAVPMASIYLTTQLWQRLRDRAFDFSPPASPSKSTEQTETPSRVAMLATPSFNRRGAAAPSLLRDATARAGSVASTARSGSGVFLNMAFIITSTGGDVDKDAIAKLIKINGGQVLEHGFHELFDLESSGEMPSSQSRRRSASAMENPAGLTLKPQYQDLGFVALISDSHSRSTKYIQALALNVPCLHLRWIQDSLSASRALSFARFLLPAGVSKFLDPNGVLRSRTIRTYDPSADDVLFAQTINDRDLLLRDQAVLLITGKSKKEIEKRAPFVFLTHALGSAAVARCADLPAAARALKDSHWDWVYVDSADASVADAAAELFGSAAGRPASAKSAKKGKKRRRDESEEQGDLVSRGEVRGRVVRVTCAEFVVQSLILGALVEE